MRGLNARSYAAAEPRAAARALAAVARLVAAGHLRLDFTEYECCPANGVGGEEEWRDAVEHAAGEGGAPCGGSKALLLLPGLAAALGAPMAARDDAAGGGGGVGGN